MVLNLESKKRLNKHINNKEIRLSKVIDIFVVEPRVGINPRLTHRKYFILLGEAINYMIEKCCTIDQQKDVTNLDNWKRDKIGPISYQSIVGKIRSIKMLL